MDKSRASRTIVVVVAGLLLLIGAGFVGFTLLRELRPGDPARPVDVSQANNPAGAPKLDVATIISGLDHPWEIAFLPDRTMLITERSNAVSKVSNGRAIALYTPPDVAVYGEGGLMGLAIDPDFAQNRYIYACYNSSRDGIVVARLIVDSGVTAAREDKKIITNMPMNPSGRHSGCRLAFGPDEYLWVGTGDAADESTPQDLNSLGGKVLRVTRDGEGVEGNITSGDKRVYSYGHRNTQGLAFYEASRDGSYGVSVEHGSSRDDEINELKPGNFGWQPGRGYDESVPMTDTARFPDAVPAIWSSGEPTIAPSDADFLRGETWGSWNGRLAMGVLKGRHLRILDITDGKLGEQIRILDGEYGRLRAVTFGPDGSLYISTDNGGDDKILKITPSTN
ncbi:PQQ-dependent sugar dehydrogenase [Candidatus Saccharibacteria bacterium]|nr:MAG: PQQ-dependent sugar dehydrogenase [Candidatus Saccharibacteria bacterium]